MKPDEREKLIDAWVVECQRLSNEEPIALTLDPLVAIAIISQIQLAIRHPENTGWMATEAVAAARDLQNLFSPDSVTYRVLQLGWNPDEDVLSERSSSPAAGTETCEVPCDDFLANRGCRCTGFRVAEVVGGEDYLPEDLAFMAAYHHEVMGIVRLALMDEDF